MAGPLVDWTGRPLQATNGAYNEASENRLRLQRPPMDKEMALMVSREKHRAMMSDARWIYTTFPLVAGAVRQKAQYIAGSGFAPQFMGADTEWGKRAEDLLRKVRNYCNVRGAAFSWAKCWEIGTRLWHIDGDFFVISARTPTGHPVFQFLEGHRVGSRYATTGAGNGNYRFVRKGPYDGARIYNGIIYDDQGAEIAYRVLGSSPDRDRDIPASEMMHVMSPGWFSEGRPWPLIAYAVLDFYDIKETRGFEKMAQKLNSALAILETNPAGLPEDCNNVIGSKGGIPSDEPAFRVETFEAGMIKYLRSGAGAIAAHESRRPSDGFLKFDQIVTAGAFYGMDWRIEMLDLSRLGGAPVRGFQDNINTVIYNGFEDISPFARRSILFQIAAFIDRGDLPEHPEWDQWSIVPPPEFTVDAFKSSQTDRENIRAGIDTHASALRRRGKDPEDALTEEARWLKLRNEIAKREGLDPRELGRTDKPGDFPNESQSGPAEEEREKE